MYRNGLAEEMNDRFNYLRALKPSFAFLENPFLVDIMENGFPTDSAAIE